MLIKPLLPVLFTGFDIETKSTLLNAYIISGALVTIDLTKFKMVEVTSIELEPENEEAKGLFHECPGTMKWWENLEEGNRFKPSKLAHQMSWGGSTPHKAGISRILQSMNVLNKRNSVFSSRGPEFDMRIFEQSAIAYGLEFRLRFSNFDSDRTHERHRLAMGVGEISDEEIKAFGISGGTWHTASFDAAIEAYHGARQLWLTAIATLEGRDGVIKALEDFKAGTFNPEKYLDKVEFNG